MPARSGELAQVRTLTRIFVARFFENEITAGRTDLTQSFFWLTAVVGAPGMLLAFYRQFAWENIVRYQGGLGVLHVDALFDKTLYLGFTFLAVALVAAIGWQAMLVDRRDALILGTFPARARTIVIGKLAALAIYTALLATGIHAGSAVLFGLFLGSLESVASVLRTVPAHFVAGFGLTLFVMASVAAIQAVLLTVAGPRRFTALSGLLQAALVVCALVTFVALPARSPDAAATFDATGLVGPAWIRALPPLWFLGVYETLAGTSLAEMHELARFAAAALATAVGLVLLVYPLASRRVLRATVEATTGPLHRMRRSMAQTLMRRLGSSPVDRAAVQFALATLGRVSTHRLMLALAAALGALGFVPLVSSESWRAGGVSPSTSIVALPFVAFFFWLIGLRGAIGTPSELGGRWLFDVSGISPLVGRRAARRILLALGVLPIATVTVIAWLWLWPPAIGLARAAASTAAALLLLEVLLWGYVRVPCTRPLPGGDLKLRTAALLVGFDVFCLESPAAHVTWGDDWRMVAAQGAFFAGAALLVAFGSSRAAESNALMAEDAEARLDLQVAFASTSSPAGGAEDPSRAG